MHLDMITDELRKLRELFVQRGFDLRLVGGVVRDTLAGIPCKDVDLCTNATPDEQVSIYSDHGYRWIETGLQHGTVTVVLDGVPYEITSLRVDVETDGRHAKVEHTRDWIQDLARRDLTINAMAMTFDGEVIDPFGGRTDLRDGVVRFVGNPVDRIREDYLRILRWFRFQGRFGNVNNIDDATLVAINENAHGLQRISRERVWSEMKRIVQHPTGPDLIWEMHAMNISRHISMGEYWNRESCIKAQAWTDAPEILVAAGQDWMRNLVSDVSHAWRWSNAEFDPADWLCRNAFQKRDLRRLIAVEGAPRDWVAELAALENRDDWSKNALVHWEFPPFPVSGADLVAAGMKPSKAMGDMLRRMKDTWADSGYKASKQELMGMLR
jgi:tRNA nucleotidyltransferase/poly(A) polymerase